MIAKPETILKAIQALEKAERPKKSDAEGDYVTESAWRRQKDKNLTRLLAVLAESKARADEVEV